jgi:hypothetical protein
MAVKKSTHRRWSAAAVVVLIFAQIAAGEKLAIAHAAGRGPKGLILCDLLIDSTHKTWLTCQSAIAPQRRTPQHLPAQHASCSTGLAAFSALGLMMQQWR